MSTMRKIFFSLAVAAMVLGAASAFAASYTFTAIDYPGATVTHPYGINTSGQIVGIYYDADGAHDFQTVGTGYTSIIFPDPGPSQSTTCGVNDAGDLVGSASGGSSSSGFLKVGDVFSPVNYPGATGTQPFDINDSGKIVGTYIANDGTMHGFLKVNDVYTNVDYPISGMEIYATGINNAGHIVGYYKDPGSSEARGFLKTDAGYTLIDYPGAVWTFAGGINDAGEIVGSFFDALGSHGFLKTDAGFTSFDYPDAGFGTTFANDINAAGQIVGYYIDDELNFRGYLATPVPLPPTLLLWGSGLLGLAGFAWRTRRG